MNTELEHPGIEGKVITGGIAQNVTREGDLTRIRLTLMPGGKVYPSTPGAIVQVALPEPVTVEAGGWVAVEMDWLPEAVQEDTGRPMRLDNGATLTRVGTGPSAQGRDRIQGLAWQ